MNIYNRTNYLQEDSPIKKDLLKLFSKNQNLIIFDIGGCEGEESIRYSRIFPNATIFIFEPLPKNQDLIAQNISKARNGKMTLIPMAVSDNLEYSDFYVSSGQPSSEGFPDWDFGNKSSSLLIPEETGKPKWLEFREKIRVRTITIEKFVSKSNITEVDFVHLDVQGAELKVLMGAGKFLSRIKSVWLEVSDLELYKDQPLRKDIEKFMRLNDFQLVKSVMNGSAGDQMYINNKYFRSYYFFSKVIHIKKIRPNKL